MAAPRVVVPRVVPRVVRRVVPRVVACRVAAPLAAAALREDLLVIPWVAVPLVVVRPVVIRRVVPGLGYPRVAWDCPQAEWVAMVVVPMVKVAKTAASRVVDSVAAQVVTSLARSANIPAVDKVPSNSARNWTNRLVISTKHSVTSSVRSRRSVAIPKVLVMAPVARVVQLAWVNRKLAVPVAVAQAVLVLAAAVARERVRRGPSMV